MQLAAEGWLVVAPRTVPRVAAATQGSDPSARAAPGTAAQSTPARRLTRTARAVRYDLRPGRPDLARFPRADWVRSLSAAVRGAGVAELDYPPIAGATRAAGGRGGVPGAGAGDASPGGEDVILCAGAGQAFVTLAEALGPVEAGGRGPRARGDPRAVRQARAASRCRCGWTSTGVVVDELPDDARAVLLTPAHQFPTGAVLTAERRAELLRWARRARRADHRGRLRRRVPLRPRAGRRAAGAAAGPRRARRARSRRRSRRRCGSAG